jgi:hypothetical protein
MGPRQAGCDAVGKDCVGEIVTQTLRDNGLDASRGQKLDSSAVHLWAVLLAGRGGVRLRELTRRIAGDSRPKPFCNERYYADDVSAAGDSCVIEQPLNRGTGIAIILALLRILQRDHSYADHDSFRLTIRSAIECRCFERYGSAAFTSISILGEAFVATSPCAIAPGLPLEYFRPSRNGIQPGWAGEGDCVFDHQEAQKQTGLRD